MFIKLLYIVFTQTIKHMKKILLSTLFLCVTYMALSQSGTYGIRAGYTISNLDFKDIPVFENKHRNSFYIGFFGDFRLTNSISIVPELQFSPEGASNETLHLDFIQAPLFLKFRLSERFRFGIGPQVALKSYKNDDLMRNFHYSALGGIEFKLNQMFFLDARYSYGLSNIFDDDTNLNAINTNIQLGIGYQF